ncbi:uncharacterized protein L969DRAFT_14904 [Mixia osmundae IAM 14324]|uniref:UvrD-like helicase ATP-binding domain-containing protein n=1 Tax=Mixia osmundae (strain CBS 9802 / IAM 14324 / JCM 22182 / KY 12970) TaxID=764103 RepID=G7E7C7_MIXOS|nr:uncharacterized protein L969DRAFT_14904 [Mixia osmundae IAM 14324]KEI42704.1 hypothetical protein L969DRAFT_14904 [Mixia osmundae IAM 14324]GAA98737.1 hypothetical protein E5Q_05425 [Mixia osmundae IAM 14324]
MSSSTRAQLLAQVSQALQTARIDPVRERVTATLLACVDVLSLAQSTNRPEEASTSEHHWFCHRAKQDGTYEPAIYSLQLLAYKASNPRVQQHRDLLSGVLDSCTDCIKAYQTAKQDVIDRYLSIGENEAAIKRFSAGMADKERTLILQELETLRWIAPSSPSSSSVAPRALPTGLYYRIFCFPAAYRNPIIRSAMSEQTHVALLSSVRSKTLLPGHIHFASRDLPDLSEWCSRMISRSAIKTDEDYVTIETEVRSLLVTISDQQHAIENDMSRSPAPSEKTPLWTVLGAVLSRCSGEIIQAHLLPASAAQAAALRTDIVRFVSSHISSSDDSFATILSVWTQLLIKLANEMWRDKAYLTVSLSDLLDNPAYKALLAKEAEDEAAFTSENRPYRAWIMPLLISIAQSKTAFVDGCSLLITTFFDHFQREHLNARTRNLALLRLVQPLLYVLTSSAEDWPYRAELIDLIDTRARVLVNAGFARSSHLAAGRDSLTKPVRAFIACILDDDCQRICRRLTALADWKRENKRIRDASVTQEQIDWIARSSQARICSGLWKATYDIVNPSHDILAIVPLLSCISTLAPFEMLSGPVWVFGQHNDLKPVLKRLNSLLTETRAPMRDLLLDIQATEQDHILALLKDREALTAIVRLMLSPEDDLHNPAQAVVKTAYDAVTRADCFRALLHNYPSETLSALTQATETFADHAQRFPDLCAASKRLVRCYTDVVEALCDQEDGLVRDEAWITRPDCTNVEQLLTFWPLMCHALAVIFDHTPTWAPNHTNEQMTDWMRDAIIFGQRLVDQCRLLSSVSSRHGSSAQAEQGRVKLTESLNEPLEALLAWMRLNDIVLLASTARLTQAMISRLSGQRIRLTDRVLHRVRKLAKSLEEDPAKNKLLLNQDQQRDIVQAVSMHPLYAAEFSDYVEPGFEEILAPPKAAVQRSVPLLKPRSTTEPASAPLHPALSLQNGKLVAGKPIPSMLPKPRPLPSANIVQKPIVPKGPRLKYSHKDAAAERERRQAGLLADDSSSSDTETRGIDILLGNKKPIIRQAEKAQGVKLLPQHQVPGLERLAVEAARQADRRQNLARMRQQVDTDPLFRSILQWDSFSDGQTPDNAGIKPQKIIDRFSSVAHYQAVMQPLLLIECWQQLVNAKREAHENGTPIMACSIVSRMSIDDFLEVTCSFPGGSVPHNVYFVDTEIVLMRCMHDELAQCFAKVVSTKRQGAALNVTFRCSPRNTTGCRAQMTPQSSWHVRKLTGLGTTIREYIALQSLPYYELAEDVLRGRLKQKVAARSDTVDAIARKHQVNQPQAFAIAAALDAEGFTLIQGPPGTGKTKTIIGLVGAFLARRKPSDGLPSEKLLICAPSNAAIDEIAARLKNGVRAEDNRMVVPKIVRIGADSAIHAAVKDLFIDEQIDALLNDGSHGDDKADEALSALRRQMEELKAERAQTQDMLARQGLDDQERGRLADVRRIQTREIYELGLRLDAEKDKTGDRRRAQDTRRFQMRNQVLCDCDIICATLSGSGHDYMAQLPFQFETVIIDEAAQSVEISSLIPLRYGAKRCIMVGDPRQLPPTVLSTVAKDANYASSLFVRMQKNHADGVHLLSIQYRMHPSISAWPSEVFYGGELRDGPGIAALTASSWHRNPLLPPYSFLHCSGAQQTGRNHSVFNPEEARVGVAIFKQFLKEVGDAISDIRVGVVTMYKAQVFELRRLFKLAFGDDIVHRLDFSTVDGFQGQEKDVIIFSCVRSGQGSDPIGFLRDARRMNVALTRAKSSLFILGHAPTLRTDPTWRRLIENAQARAMYREVTANTFTSSVMMPAVLPTSPIKARSSNSQKGAAPALPLVKPKDEPAAVRPNGLRMSQDGSSAPVRIVKTESRSKPDQQAILPPVITTVVTTKKRIRESIDTAHDQSGSASTISTTAIIDLDDVGRQPSNKAIETRPTQTTSNGTEASAPMKGDSKRRAPPPPRPVNPFITKKRRLP